MYVCFARRTLELIFHIKAKSVISLFFNLTGNKWENLERKSRLEPRINTVGVVQQKKRNASKY